MPAHIYYTTASAMLSATSSDQTVVADGGIAVTGTGFDRSITFTPLKEGTATITATMNDGTSTASTAFSVTVHQPASVASVDMPAAGYYCIGSNLDFTVHFTRDVLGGAGSVLPITVGGVDVNAVCRSVSGSAASYRYTLAAGDVGAVAVGNAIDDTATPFTDTTGVAAEVGFTATLSGVTALPPPVPASSASGGTAVYGAAITFTASIASGDTLAGTVQFINDGVNMGAPVALSGNTASYVSAAGELTAGLHAITATYIPSGAAYHFASQGSYALSINITEKSVSVSGLVATARAYDGTADVALTGGTLSGVLSGDDVTPVCPTVGTAAQKNAGTRSVTFAAVTLAGADKDNYTLSAQPIVSVVISPAALTVTANAASRAYDATTTATAKDVVFTGLVSGETLAAGVDYSATGTFAGADAGTSVSATLNIALLSTTAAGNYTLASGTVASSADITPKPITIGGVSATDRAYDGTASVTLTGGTLAGVETADAANVGFTLGGGTLADANAGTARPVTTAIMLTGGRAGNYSLSQPSGITVNIAKLPLLLESATVTDKVYDGTRTATVTDATLSGTLAGETLGFATDYTASALFASADVNAGVSVTVTVTLATTGTAANYSLPINTFATTASITHSGVTITGVTAVNRAYDGTLAVALSGGMLVGVPAADSADVGFSLHSATVPSAGIGDAKPVTTAITLTGAKAANYTLTQPTGITVDIRRATLSATGATVTDKAYDGNTTATITGVTFSGLAAGESLTCDVDYSASGSFATASAGAGKNVLVVPTLRDTALTANYQLSGSCSATATIIPLTITGTVRVDAANTTGDPDLVDGGDVLTVNTGGISVPTTLTATCQWTRNGSDVAGANTSTYAIGALGADPVGTYFTAKVTGTGNYQGTLESAAVTVYEMPLGGSVSISGTPKPGLTLSLATAAITPAAATYGIAWLRDGTPIAGASGASYLVQKADYSTTLKAVVTGTGYFAGALEASLTVPPNPYVPDGKITETPTLVEVDLTGGSTLLSVEQLNALLALNAAKPVVFEGAGYSITFPVGAMGTWPDDLNLGIQFNTGTGYAAIQARTGTYLVLMLQFLHDGPLPCEVEVAIDVGVAYAGQTLEYLYYDPLTGKLSCVQTAVVDALGWLKVKQDHCSSYAVARIRPAAVPDTGDRRFVLGWWLLTGASAAGLLALLACTLKQRSRRRQGQRGQPPVQGAAASYDG